MKSAAEIVVELRHAGGPGSGPRAQAAILSGAANNMTKIAEKAGALADRSPTSKNKEHASAAHWEASKAHAHASEVTAGRTAAQHWDQSRGHAEKSDSYGT